MSVYEGHGVTLHHGDCLDVLRTLPDASVDSVVTDPPYGLEFMGKEWDSFKATGSSSLMHSPKDEGREFTNASGHMWDNTKALPRFAAGTPFQRWCELWATECLRVLKPGGHLLAFGGTRTWHRLACAVEDAGFEVRDSIAWLHGQGFPKSLDVSKAIDKAAGAEREVVGRYRPPNGTTWNLANDEARASIGPVGHSDRAASLSITAPATDAAEQWQGWGTALKPAFEPVVVARKPLAGTVAANVLEHGTGALNIDGCRVGDGGQLSWAEPRGIGYMGGGSNAGAVAATENAKGRWPANVVLDETQAEALDEQSGERPGFSTQRNAKESEPGSSWFGTRKGDTRAGEIREGYNDTGGASRFFFIAREDNPCHSTSSASTVESPSSHPRGPADSAPSDAATTACPDGERLTGSPSTSETPSASRPSVESGTTPTTSTAGASSPDWQPGEPSQMVSRARYAASLSRTATTTTTTSPSSSAGSVDPTTSSTTQASAPGVPLDELGSRFNYVAKADASERPRVNGTAHPTVKPLDLMRWLVRLVTPPGGTVLEPFAGSGTTVEACIVEGFQCIAIEREADYLPLIRQRIDRRRDPVEALRGQAADLGLFDLLGGELA